MDYGQNPAQPFTKVEHGDMKNAGEVFDAKNNLDLTNQADEWGNASLDTSADASISLHPSNSAALGAIAIQSAPVVPRDFGTPTAEPTLTSLTEKQPTSLDGREYVTGPRYNFDNQESLPPLGEVVNVEQPPRITQNTKSEANSTPAYAKSNIKTTETLGEAGVREVANIIRKLGSDDDAASFYNVARDMMETNLQNSYGEHANWKEEA